MLAGIAVMSNFLPPKDMAVRVKVKPVKSSKVTVEKERAGPYLKMNCSVMIQSWASFWYAYSTVSAPSVWTLFVPNIYVYIYIGFTQRGNITSWVNVIADEHIRVLLSWLALCTVHPGGPAEKLSACMKDSTAMTRDSRWLCRRSQFDTNVDATFSESVHVPVAAVILPFWLQYSQWSELTPFVDSVHGSSSLHDTSQSGQLQTHAFCRTISSATNFCSISSPCCMQSFKQNRMSLVFFSRPCLSKQITFTSLDSSNRVALPAIAESILTAPTQYKDPFPFMMAQLAAACTRPPRSHRHRSSNRVLDTFLKSSQM